MKHWLRVMVVCLFLVGGVSACSNQAPELKSPCVGASGSPCDDRWPVNDHWLHPEKQPAPQRHS